MLALISAAAVLSQPTIDNQYTRIEYAGATRQTGSVAGQYFLGTGKYVKVNEALSQVAITSGVGCTSTVALSVGFARVANRTCSVEQCSTEPPHVWMGATGTVVASCARGKQGEAEIAAGTAADFCVALNEQPISWTDFHTINVATPSPTNPQYIKAYGSDTYAFFMFYEVTTSSTAPGGTCEFDLNLSWNARVKDPADGFCVSEIDTEVPIAGYTPPYDNPKAAMPRHSSNNFVHETSYIPMKNAAIANLENFNINKKFLDLGRAPMLEMSCLGVYVTASDATSCPAAREGTDLVSDPNIDAYLKESFDCNAFVDASLGEEVLPVGLLGNDNAERETYAQCCSMTSAGSCHFLTVGPTGATTKACFWVEATKRCYPEFSSSTTDLSGMVGLTDSVTFSSSHSHRPISTYVAEARLVKDYLDGSSSRRWHLVIENKHTDAACGVYVTTSFHSTTTGGLCEPSSRRLCDQTEEQCVSTQVTTATTPIFWESGKARLSLGDALEVIDEDKFKTCNCLKQKEVCYRKNGCISTKRYQLILMNCVDAGCGDYCSSASALQLSLMSVLLVIFATVF